MELIDSHCHLDGFSLEELAVVFANAAKVSVNRLICIGASSGIESVRSALALAEAHPFIWASAGFHPHDADSFTDLEPLNEWFAHPRLVAIGETGLDFYRDWADREKQFELFRQSIRTAKQLNKPLIIHSRDAREETLQVLRAEGADSVGGVFHCYSEDAPYAERLRELRFFVSFTGSLTFKRAQELREAARRIPLSQILVETDTPYMAPEPFRGKPSEPMHVYQVALKLAEIKGVSLEEVAETTTTNVERLFSIGRHSV